MESRRARSWAFVVYPDDSLPSNYMEIIESWHIPCLISPVHDRDLNADETEKKKHRHILLCFDGMKSYNQIKDYTEQLKGTIPIIVENTNGMIRYFIHADNPEKAQYKITDLISVSGLDYSNAFDNKANDYKMFALFESICKTEGIDNLYILIEYCKAQNLFDLVDWLRLHCNTYIRTYLKDKYYAKNKKMQDGEYFTMD